MSADYFGESRRAVGAELAEHTAGALSLAEEIRDAAKVERLQHALDEVIHLLDDRVQLHTMLRPLPRQSYIWVPNSKYPANRLCVELAAHEPCLNVTLRMQSGDVLGLHRFYWDDPPETT